MIRTPDFLTYPEYADKMGQTKTMAIERILAERFAEQKEKKSGEQ